MTNWSLDDRLHPQSEPQSAAWLKVKLTSWTKLQQSEQVAAELTDMLAQVPSNSQADILQPHSQITVQADKTQLSWQVAAEVTDYIEETDRPQPISAAICLLSYDPPAWQQYVSSLCQLSCDTSAQLHPVSSDETCHLSSTCWDCKPAGTLQLSWHVAAGLTSCSWADINSSKSSSMVQKMIGYNCYRLSD